MLLTCKWPRYQIANYFITNSWNCMCNWRPTWLHTWQIVMRRTNREFWFLTTIATNLAVWLANLPLVIRVRAMLLVSMYRSMPVLALWLDIVVKNKSKCGFMWTSTMSMRHCSGQNLLWTRLCLMSPQHLHHCDDAYLMSIRVQTTVIIQAQVKMMNIQIL